jgi:hypothetical protein
MVAIATGPLVLTIKQPGVTDFKPHHCKTHIEHSSFAVQHNRIYAEPSTPLESPDHHHYRD